VTSASGMPFPRGKANLYDPGTHVPLLVRGPEVKAGRKLDALVSTMDLAPTVLEAAGLAVPAAMTGASWLPLLRGAPGGEKGRERVFLERERHWLSRATDGGYPSRAVRTKDHLYVRNLRPDRWPAGDPSKDPYGGFDDCDPSPTKEMIVGHKDDDNFGKPFQLAMAKRPGEELYDLRKDPWQVVNLAGKPAFASVARRLRADLERWMKETNDPRLDPQDDRFDRTVYFPAGR
jgi:N-sulfoglucosamine sulfohydrolase